MTDNADTDKAKQYADVAYADADAVLRAEMRIGQTWPASARSRPLQTRYPDFLVIGAQKAGTTWLYRNLNYHPEVWLPPIKEVNYFNEVYLPSSDGWESNDRLSEVAEAEKGYLALEKLTLRQRTKQEALEVIKINSRTDDWYGQIFSHAGDDLMCGEITPEYTLLPRAAITRIVQLNPAVKAVLVVRDPIDRIWSNARMTAYRTSEETPDYFLQDMHWPVMLGRSNYPAIIARWSNILPSKNFIVLSFDDLTQSPMSFLEKFCRRVGLRFDARFFPIAETAVREGLPTEMPSDLLAILRQRTRFLYDGLMRCFPEIAEPWVKRHYG